MAELACFVVSSTSSHLVTWSAIKGKAVKAMLASKIAKEKKSEYHDSILFGFAPPPEFAHRFKSETKNGIDYDDEMYEIVGDMLADGLNALQIKSEGYNPAILRQIVQVRHLEGLAGRYQDESDVMYHNADLLKLAIMIACNLKDDILETTLLTESNDIVYQDEWFTITKLDYSKHKLLPLKTVEYKITPNSEKEAPESAQNALAAYIRYNYNTYAVIEHGKKHWRLVPHTTIQSHAERMYRTFNAYRRNNIQIKYHATGAAFVHSGWVDCLQQLVAGANIEACRQSLFKRHERSKAVKQMTQDIKTEAMSRVG
ncbi:NSP2 [Rotavirus K]|nr:NSP2 [Rotavirus K]